MFLKISAKLEELFGIDIRALALMRIAFAACILIDLSDHLPYIKMLYSDEGVLPRPYVIHMLDPNAICLNLMSGSIGFQVFLFCLTALFTIGLLLGFRTRWCTFAVWILLSSFHNRNYFLLGAEDKLLHILLFWFLFLPWGACYSMDSRGSKTAPPLRVSSMGSMAYLLQIAFFYTFAGLLKTDPQWTTYGTAMSYVMNIDEFVKPSAHLMIKHPLLMHQLTFSVWWLERYGAIFFFIPFKNTWFRLGSIAAFVGFHIGILLTMELRLFQWICLIMLVGFLPTSFLNLFLSSKAYAGTEKPMPAGTSLLAAFLIVYVLFWNLGELQGPSYQVPAKLRWIGYTLNLYQHWGMFAPRPMTDDGWYVIPGRLRDGKTVDIYNDGKPVRWQEPASIPKLDKMYHLTLYGLNIRRQENAYYRAPWADYLCRQWDSTHPAGEQLLWLNIYFMERDILPDARNIKPRPVLLISHRC